AALTVTVTYLAEDTEVVGPEAQRMLASLAFAHDDTAGPRGMPRGDGPVSIPLPHLKSPPGSKALPPDAGRAGGTASVRAERTCPPPPLPDDDDEPTPSPKKKKKHKKGRTH